MKVKKNENIDKHQENRKNPYKGLDSYEETDVDMFYGRDEETENLSRLGKLNFLTVVFGKAGIGKTSLLNAGVFPLLREKEFFPIQLRLNYSEGASPLLTQIHQTILKELKECSIEIKAQERDDPGEPISPGETLWEYFHRAIHFNHSEGKIVTPVLVFDQFEELFTLGKGHKDKDALIDELYWLIEDQFPVPLKEHILKSDRNERRFSFYTARPDARVIISLREDYLPHFTELKSRIASIDRTMFRVINLNGKQAREVITMPGGFRDERLINDILRCF
jgi:hypothetical protein